MGVGYYGIRLTALVYIYLASIWIYVTAFSCFLKKALLNSPSVLDLAIGLSEFMRQRNEENNHESYLVL